MWTMKNLFSFVVFIILSSSAFAKAPKVFSSLLNEAKHLKEVELRDLVADFVRSSSPSRIPGTEGHAKAIMFLQNKIKEFDPKNTGVFGVEKFKLPVEKAVKLYQDDFQNKVVPNFQPNQSDYKKWKTFTDLMVSEIKNRSEQEGINLVWEKTGSNPKKWITIIAHYDTISHDKNTLLVKAKDKMPGANYNASGVAIGLGLLKLMAEMDLVYSVRIAFVDYSVFGFMGSEMLAERIDSRVKKGDEEVVMVFNLEMLGQDTSALDSTKKLGNLCVYGPKDAELNAATKKMIENGSKMTKEVSFEFRPNGFDGSDHVRFWERGISALVFSQNWEEDFNPKFYQTPQDTAETLNFKTLYNAYLSLAGMTAGTALDLMK